jgi:hypothetical protein
MPVFLLLACVELPIAGAGGEQTDTVILPLPPELWVLVHPSEAPAAGPGIVHLDGDGVELGRLPIPPGLSSPHALTHDGASLWVSGYSGGEEQGILQVDPSTGAVGATIPIPIPTEGIAADGDGFWMAGSALTRVDATGAITDRRPGAGTIQDLAFDGTDLWFLVNGSPDSVSRVDPLGRPRVVADPVSDDSRSYGMTWYEGELLVIDTAFEDPAFPDGTALLRHVDPYTGERIGTSELPLEGWLTALVVPRSVQLEIP